MAELPSERLFGDYGEWPGRDVLDSSGDRLGDVREIYLDRETGRPEWVLVEIEGDQPRFVPLADASVESSAIRVAHPASLIRAAPDVGPEAHIGNDEERRLYSHYGIAYSESQSDSGLPVNVTVGGAGPQDDTPPEDTASPEAAAAGTGPHAPPPGEDAGTEPAAAEAGPHAPPPGEDAGTDPAAAEAGPHAPPPAEDAGDEPAAEEAPAGEAPAGSGILPLSAAAPPAATPGLPQSGFPEPPAFAPEEPPATPGLPQPEPAAAEPPATPGLPQPEPAAAEPPATPGLPQPPEPPAMPGVPQPPEPPPAFPPPPPPPAPGRRRLALTGDKRRLGLAGAAALGAAALFLVARRLRS